MIPRDQDLKPVANPVECFVAVTATSDRVAQKGEKIAPGGFGISNAGVEGGHIPIRPTHDSHSANRWRGGGSVIAGNGRAMAVRV